MKTRKHIDKETKRQGNKKTKPYRTRIRSIFGVMAHIWIRDATRTNEPCNTWMSHVTHMIESWHHKTKPYCATIRFSFQSCHMYEGVISHMNESCHACEWVLALLSESRHAHEWVMAQKEWVMAQKDKTILRKEKNRRGETRQKQDNKQTRKEEENTTLRKDSWVMAHVWMIHGTRMDESCHTYEYNVAQGLDESRHTDEWAMSYIWMSHVKHIHTICARIRWVMAHMWMSHVTHMNESYHTYEYHNAQGLDKSCHTYGWVMSHKWMSHVTHRNESCHT